MSEGECWIEPPLVLDDGLLLDGKRFEQWQQQLDDELSRQSCHTDQGWYLTLYVISGFRLHIPHVECGLLEEKNRRRHIIRSWLVGDIVRVPRKCRCYFLTPV